MKKTTVIPCPLSRSFMIYGAFTVFCQLVFIVLNINIRLLYDSPALVRYIYVPWLEYPILSLALILAGACLFDYINIRDQL